MAKEIFDIIIKSAEGSFLQVTVFVGAALLLFNYINFVTHGGLINLIEKNRKWQPVIGAVLGVTPGCGGAILVMPLYLKGTVTFGTVVATLAATAGDSAFIMITKMPAQFFLVSAISMAVGIITGYAVDYSGFGMKLQKAQKHKTPEELEELHKLADHSRQKTICSSVQGCPLDHIAHIGHQEGDEIDLVLHHELQGELDPDTINYKVLHRGYWVYWVVIAVGLILGIMLLFRIDVNNLGISNLGLMVGVTGTVFSVALLILGKHYLADDTHEEVESKLMSLKETFIHNAGETAFVGAWVFGAYLVYELMVLAAGGGNMANGQAAALRWMTSAGLASVIVGALVGLIPGCGPQVIFVTLYTRGLLPFAALLSNAISQDGDALFPLLAMDRKSSLWATVITTVPAILFGILVYYLETKTVLGTIFKAAVLK